MSRARADRHAARAMESLDGSLARLQRDTIDLLLQLTYGYLSAAPAKPDARAETVLANALTRAGLSVLLLESGGERQIEEVHPLNAVELTAQNYRGATEGRFRGLGGTSTRWGGVLLSYLESDFAPHPCAWHWGWGIETAELDPYLASIEHDFGVCAGSYEGAGELESARVAIAAGAIETTRLLLLLERAQGMIWWRAADSVVDAQRRVHGLDGLWAVATSVFPTVGGTSPSLGLLQLALRAADDIVGSVADELGITPKSRQGAVTCLPAAS